MNAIVRYPRCPSGLCVPFIIKLDIQAFSRIYDSVCFILAMSLSNCLDEALSGYLHDLVCLFSSVAEGAAGPKARGNILITTIQSQHCVLRSERWIVVSNLQGGKTHARNKKQRTFESLLFHLMLALTTVNNNIFLAFWCSAITRTHLGRRELRCYYGYNGFPSRDSACY